MLERYVGDQVRGGYVSRFLLNDIIRYWRTICVDYEFKTAEVGKEWAIRNIKLVWSRKLMYFGGILMVAEATNGERGEKLDVLVSLTESTPLDKLKLVGQVSADEILKLYNYYLERMCNGDIRARLTRLGDDRTDEVYREIKDRGEDFTRALHEFLRARYPQDHRIHMALVW